MKTYHKSNCSTIRVRVNGLRIKLANYQSEGERIIAPLGHVNGPGLALGDGFFAAAFSRIWSCSGPDSIESGPAQDQILYNLAQPGT